jgi:hypothetical protein
MVRSIQRLGLFCFICLICLLPVAAEESAGAAGYWSGSIEIPGNPIEVMVDLSEGDDHGWEAVITIPSQGVHDVSLVDVAVDGAKAGFRIDQVPGEPTFAGTLSEDGSSLDGTFTQGGQSLPFKLARSERPTNKVDVYAEYTVDGTPGSGLAGRWLGIIQAGPHRLRMKLTVEGEAGAQSATLLSVDQAGAKFTAGVTTDEAGKITIDIPDVGGTIEGTMSDDGSTIDASWTQGGNSVPLKLIRTKAE